MTPFQCVNHKRLGSARIVGRLAGFAVYSRKPVLVTENEREMIIFKRITQGMGSE